MTLPMDELRAVARRELDKAQAQPLFVTISGAHLYGFPSPDSDFDVRGCHLLPLPAVVSLSPQRETIVLLEGLAGDDEVEPELRQAAAKVVQTLKKKPQPKQKR